MFKYAEMLMAEEDDKVCELIFKQQDNLILKINDRFPRIIIKKYRTLQGKVVWLWIGNDSNLLIVFYVQIMPDDFVMQLHRF
ncbi:hypothetical protein ACNEVU_004911 [Escherichia coli]|uniref:hypothetical protein n=1 Tax=Escherichia coli TaxID=562 RepID=UPI00201E4576|nr:hypothetical protein [Escherichia coli]